LIETGHYLMWRSIQSNIALGTSRWEVLLGMRAFQISEEGVLIELFGARKQIAARLAGRSTVDDGRAAWHAQSDRQE
jgi:hypothetical protein